MTTYINFINKVKEKCDASWLTPSQKKIFCKLKTGLNTQRIINVYGAEGSGKTFLGWVLEKEQFGKYFVNIQELFDQLAKGSSSRIVVIDNFPPERNTHRNFRSKMLDMGIDKAVILTQSAIPDDIPRLRLDFNEKDRESFKVTCYRMTRIQMDCERESDTMHTLIKNNIWRWAND